MRLHFKRVHLSILIFAGEKQKQEKYLGRAVNSQALLAPLYLHAVKLQSSCLHQTNTLILV